MTRSLGSHGSGEVCTCAITPGVAAIGLVRHENRLHGSAMGTRPDVELLLIPLILTGVFLMPFALAWLEPKPMQAPTHRAQTRRTPPR